MTILIKLTKQALFAIDMVGINFELDTKLSTVKINIDIDIIINKRVS